LYIAWIKQYNGANHFITNEDDGNMLCEKSLKWIVSAKNGVPRKFDVDGKHKTHYIFGIKALQLCESKHKHLCIHLICMSCGHWSSKELRLLGFFIE
jgi:ribosomal protein L32